MFIFKGIKELNDFVKIKKQDNLKIGFVPTMGALHQGHLSLIKNSLEDNDITICSIFVNPTQFDDAQDLEKYPRPVEKDIALLEEVGCSALFLPSVQEIYPDNLVSPTVDLKGLDKSMEGAHRDGHFQGVVQVVHRLLDIVQTDRLYMGQKDFQQFSIIKHMINVLQLPVELIRVPIARADDGLALSSRNIRLSVAGRKEALRISQTLFLAKERSKTLSLQSVKEQAMLDLKGMEIDYFSIVNADTLEEIQDFAQAKEVVACTTVRVNNVRLLDNIYLKEDS